MNTLTLNEIHLFLRKQPEGTHLIYRTGVWVKIESELWQGTLSRRIYLEHDLSRLVDAISDEEPWWVF